MMQFDAIAALTIHDVKNRLAQLAARAEARGDVETLRSAFAAAAQLTRLLVFYKSETGALRPDVDAHAPQDLVAELAADASRSASIRVEQDAGAAPSLGFYDETLVRMVLANAVDNALRFARTRIAIAAAGNDRWLEFAVSDDGEGYPPSVLADAGSDDASAPVSRDGTGLGLRLAARIAALHENRGERGLVRLANDGGAVFTLLLPL
jgi:signal transduction histidine kinase